MHFIPTFCILSPATFQIRQSPNATLLCACLFSPQPDVAAGYPYHYCMAMDVLTLLVVLAMGYGSTLLMFLFMDIGRTFLTVFAMDFDIP